MKIIFLVLNFCVVRMSSLLWWATVLDIQWCVVLVFDFGFFVFGVCCLVWSLEFCVWCLVFGVWCLVFGVWCLVFGVWCLVFGVWCLVFGVWFLIFGFWFLVFGFWFLVFGFWFLVFGFWFLVFGFDEFWIFCQSTTFLVRTKQKKKKTRDIPVLTYNLAFC
jgi:hypothetical protein